MDIRIKDSGLTLIELMVCLAVFAILLATVAPNWQAMIERQQGRQIQSQLRTIFHTARIAAVHQGQLVTLCPLDETNRCTNNWQLGISVFHDPDNNRELTSPDQLVREFSPFRHGKITASSAGIAERRYFQYNPDGTVRGTIGHLVWCPNSAKPEHGFQLRINFGGRIRWAQDTTGDGIVEMASGQPISC